MEFKEQVGYLYVWLLLLVCASCGALLAGLTHGKDGVVGYAMAPFLFFGAVFLFFHLQQRKRRGLLAIQVTERYLLFRLSGRLIFELAWEQLDHCYDLHVNDRYYSAADASHRSTPRKFIILQHNNPSTGDDKAPTFLGTDAPIHSVENVLWLEMAGAYFNVRPHYKKLLALIAARGVTIEQQVIDVRLEKEQRLRLSDRALVQPVAQEG